ncbi:hypothetical protein BDF21DRAFT_453112 [Thamnidium elegans]|nr:hypothetical protein BDF21DRAFT_453112 [Thamnidium elegans]
MGYQEVNGSGLRRPQVFEDYESQKSSVDANNNRRDNMVSFHDIIKTYRWEVRFLSFVFGIAEANAFSCYKIWGNNAEGILHSDFKCRLTQSLLKKVKDFGNYEEAGPMNTRSRASDEAHRYVVLAQYPEGKRTCKERGVKPFRVSKRCACNLNAMCQKCHQLHFAQEMNNNIPM